MRYLYQLLLLGAILPTLSFGQWPTNGTYQVGTPGAFFQTLSAVHDSLTALSGTNQSLQYTFEIADGMHSVPGINWYFPSGHQIEYSSLSGDSGNCKILVPQFNNSGGTFRFTNITVNVSGVAGILMTPPSSGSAYLYMESSALVVDDTTNYALHLNGGNDGAFAFINRSRIQGGISGIINTGDYILEIDSTNFINQSGAFINLAASCGANVKIQESNFESNQFTNTSQPFVFNNSLCYPGFHFERNQVHVTTAAMAMRMVAVPPSTVSTTQTHPRIANNLFRFDTTPAQFNVFDIGFDINFHNDFDSVFVHNNTIVIENALSIPSVLSTSDANGIFVAHTNANLFFANNNLVSNQLWKIDRSMDTSFSYQMDYNNYYPGAIDLLLVQSYGSDSNALQVNPYFTANSFVPQNNQLNNKGMQLPYNALDLEQASHDNLPDIGCYQFSASTASSFSQGDTLFYNCYFNDSLTIQMSNGTTPSDTSGTLFIHYNSTVLHQSVYTDTATLPIQPTIAINLSTLPDSGTFYIDVIDSSGVFNNKVSNHQVIVIHKKYRHQVLSVNCPGDSILLSSLNGQNVLWNDGAFTDQRMFITSSSPLYYTSSDSTFCYRDTTSYLLSFTTPINLLNDTVKYCENSIAVFNLSSYPSVLWGDSSTIKHRAFDTTGIMTVQVINNNNCYTNDSTLLYQWNEYVPLWDTNFLCTGDSQVIDLTGMVNVVVWDNGSNAFMQTGHPGDSLKMLYTDSNQCSFQHTFHLLQAPTVAVFDWTDTTLCTYDSVLVDYTSFANSIVWSDAQNNTSRWLYPNDSLSFVLIDTFGCINHSYHSVDSFVVPFLSPYTNAICDGDTALVSISSSITQLWSNGSTNDTLLILDSDTVSVEMIGLGNCFYYDTVLVQNYTPDAPNWPSDTTTCDSILCIEAFNLNNTYIWNNGHVGTQLCTGHEGLYIVTVTNGSCDLLDSIYINIDSLPIAQFSDSIVTFDLYCTNQSINATHYIWETNFGATDTTTDFYTNQLMLDVLNTVTLIAFNDCGSDTLVKVVAEASVQDWEQSGLSVYPNPFNNIVSIANVTQPVYIELYDATGAKLMHKRLNYDQQFDLRNLANGLYFITVTINNQSFSTQLIKQ